jgi:hypothetical protein
MKKMQFLFFMKNMLAKILEFGRMQQKNIYIFKCFENFLFFLKYFGENRVF